MGVALGKLDDSAFLNVFNWNSRFYMSLMKYFSDKILFIVELFVQLNLLFRADVCWVS